MCVITLGQKTGTFLSISPLSCFTNGKNGTVQPPCKYEDLEVWSPVINIWKILSIGKISTSEKGVNNVFGVSLSQFSWGQSHFCCRALGLFLRRRNFTRLLHRACGGGNCEWMCLFYLFFSSGSLKNPEKCSNVLVTVAKCKCQAQMQHPELKPAGKKKNPKTLTVIVDYSDILSHVHPRALHNAQTRCSTSPAGLRCSTAATLWFHTVSAFVDFSQNW